MGWLLGWNSRSEVIKHLNEDVGTGCTLVKSCIKGSTQWQVIDTPKGRYIACNLIGGSKDGYGYKDMCEGMNPYQYSCPLSYLEITPVASEEWRVEVRKWNEAQKGKSKSWLLTVGDSSRQYNWAKKYSEDVVREHFKKHMGDTEFKLEAVK